MMILTLLSLLLFSALTAALSSASLPDGALSIPLKRGRNNTAYFAKFELGTPPQSEYLLVDTGSQTIDFVSPNANLCTQPGHECTTFGTFDNRSSSTCEYVESGFTDDIVDGGFGDVLQDTLYIDGKSVNNFTFGYIDGFAYASQTVLPVAAIAGFLPSCTNTSVDSCYDSQHAIIAELYNAGAINRRAYSVYLGPEDSSVDNSEVLLGGYYDRAKQGGDPFSLPMELRYGLLSPSSVNLTAVTAVIESQTFRADLQPANTTILDTGTPNLELPSAVYAAVYAALGSPTQLTTWGFGYIVDCKYRNLSASKTITFEFGGPRQSIDVPVASLVGEYSEGLCSANIGNAYNEVVALGDPFLRNAYVTFDIEATTVTLAQACHTSEQDIVPLPALS